MKHKRLKACCRIIALFLLCLGCTEQTLATNNKILVVSSYGADYQWSNLIIDGINQEIKAAYPGLELNVEYLSSELFTETANWKLKMTTILSNYEGNPPLAIVLVSDEAWMAYRAVDTKEFNDIPLLLCAVKPHSIQVGTFKQNIKELKLSQFESTRQVMSQYNATGVLRNMNVKDYLSLMERIVPNMNNVTLITDNRFYGVYTRLLVEQEIAKTHPKLPVEYLDARFVNTVDILNRLPHITPTTGVLMTSWLTGEHGFEYSKYYVYKQMSAKLKSPIFLTNNIGLDETCFLGGYFNNGQFWGEKLGKMLIDIIGGETPGNLPPVDYFDTECHIDWKTLRKFNISTRNLPKETIFHNAPESVFTKYRNEIYTLISLFAVILFAYFLTLRNNLRLQKAQKIALQSIEEVNAANDQLREAREHLIAAVAKAEESDRLKSAFVANMSHEIRTPLNAIIGFSGLITAMDTDEERAEATSIIKRNSDLLLQLVSDILDISKMEAGMLKFEFDEVTITHVCEDVVSMLQEKCKPGVTLTFVEPTEPLVLYTDPYRLLQVLLNLTNNALKFTNSGSIELGYFSYNNDLVEFYVKDTGIGIAPQNLSSVFERFVKLNNYVEGTGLGLVICKTIVEILGGEIGVESQEGVGSRFWFRIRKNMKSAK